MNVNIRNARMLVEVTNSGRATCRGPGAAIERNGQYWLSPQACENP